MGILIENLSFHYTGTPVLDQVNLEVKDGDYAILTGENGSGKSTFLKLLLGELKAQEGSITVNGKDISATFGKGDLGYVPQNSISRNQNFPATVEEIMMTGVYSSSWKARFRAKKEIPRFESRTCGNGNGRVLEKKDRRSFRRTAAEGYAGTCTGRKTEDPDPG